MAVYNASKYAAVGLTLKRLLDGDRAMRLDPALRGDHERRVAEQTLSRKASA